MGRKVYEYRRRRRRRRSWSPPPPNSQTCVLCPSRQLQFILIVVFCCVSVVYLNSNVGADKMGQPMHSRSSNWGFGDLFRYVHSEDMSNTKVFIHFKGARRRELTFRKNPQFSLSKCPTSLQHRMLDNSWTSSIYSPTIHMLMNSQLLNQSEWSRLLPYYMPFGYRSKSTFSFREVMSTLQLFSAENSIFSFTNGQEPQCVSCAVVCNGGILNGSRKGQEIDDHDMVFRVNKAVRRDHEMDVGNRTTHYFFFDRSLRETSVDDVPKDKGMIYVFIPCRDNDYKYIRYVVQNKEAKIRASGEDIRLLHPDFVRYIHKIWVNSPMGSFRPTTGTLMLFTALFSGCDKISVYGMGYNDNFTLYYYDDKFRHFRMDKQSHDTKSELKILKRLDKMGAIEWYKRGIENFFH